jgi:dihydrofolate reductase
MGTIKVHEFITLDGVIESPRWTADYSFEETGQAVAGVMADCTAILLGRNTYEMFAPAWSTRTAEDDPGAPFMNDTPKYVVSSTLKSAAAWQNTTILGAYDADSIDQLKEQVDGGIYVSGSATLVQGMLADGLVDELHLFVFPLSLGSGQRLFADGEGPTKFRLAASEAFSTGVLHLTYVPASADTAV